MPESFVERLAAVKVGIYDRTDGERITQVGVSAQSLQKLLPEAITKAADEMGTLSVSYGNAAMAAAVELAKEIVALKKELAAIKYQVHKGD
jgi:CDP-diacylglycerol pyrophosphatase